MATISSLGVGSGVDLNSIVNQLVALERRPLQEMQAQAKSIQTRLSSMGQIQSLFSKLQDSANALGNATLWTGVTAASSDTSSVQVRAGAGTPAGSYQVTVQRLAAAQTAASAAALPSATSPVGAGELSIEVGSWTTGNTSFTARAGGNPLRITVTADDTLATLRDKINGSGGAVSAALVTDASGSRLTLRSRETGAESGFRVQVTDADGANADGAGLSRFRFDPPSGGGLGQTQAASDAQATINGIEVVSASNTMAGVIEGMTLTLGKVSTAPVDITVSTDTEGIRKAISGFASAYSDLAKYIADQTRFDPATKAGGPLQGDSAANSLQARLRSLVGAPSAASSTLSRLSDIGLQLQRDGSMTVNSARLDNAMGNLTELRRALSAIDTEQPTNAGLARRFADFATAVLGSDGAVANRQAGLRRELTANQARQDKVNERAERTERRLIEQYGALDRNASRLNGLNSFVGAQLAALSRNAGG